MTFNACGVVCNNGDVNKVADPIVSSLRDFTPVILTLNEICRPCAVELAITS